MPFLQPYFSAHIFFIHTVCKPALKATAAITSGPAQSRPMMSLGSIELILFLGGRCFKNPEGMMIGFPHLF